MFPKAIEFENSIQSLFQKSREVSLTVTVEAFMRSETGILSPHTRTWYRKCLTPMVDSLGANRLLSDLAESDLFEYASTLGRKYSGSPFTLHAHLRAMKRLFRWLYKKDILPVNLSADIRLPRLPRQGRKGISDSNLKAILEASRASKRDYAMLMFLASTGIRRGGLANLKLSDLNLDQTDDRLRRRATVLEKGNKERTVIMNRETLVALEDYLTERPKPDIDRDYVFLCRSPGQPWHRISEDGISGMVERYKAELGLTGPCSPHQFRHRWARSKLMQGMELSQVSKLLGHEDVSLTVRYYGQFDIDQLQDAYDRYSD